MQSDKINTVFRRYKFEVSINLFTRALSSIRYALVFELRRHFVHGFSDVVYVLREQTGHGDAAVLRQVDVELLSQAVDLEVETNFD